MARVFLSYAREDAGRAKMLADAIALSGHDVWWDRDIDGGSRFANEIDLALANAQAVVVLWSEASIRSAWVQDEAAEGRDADRLVPVKLDACKPPLGFRQYQSIDLSNWDPDREAPEFHAVLKAISRRAGEDKRLASVLGAEASNRSDRNLTICVLPFVNMSGDPEQEYFSDGITEDIITDLSKVSALSVVARNSSFAFKGKAVQITHLAREVNASHVLEGSVRKAAGRVRISAQLVGGAAGDHVWADRYDRELTDIFDIQDEISKAIVSALKLKLLPEEKRAIEQRGTNSPEGYDLFLMARQYWIEGNDGDPRRDQVILRLCRKAVEIDPCYARAWALIALTQSIMKFRDQELPDNGLAAAERALSHDPALAEPYCVKAAHLMTKGLHAEANGQIEMALGLDPHSWEVNKEAGVVLLRQDRLEDAIPYLQKAADLMETDYRCPGLVASCYYHLEQIDTAKPAARVSLERAERALLQDPANGAALGWGACALAILGDVERAKAWVRRALLIDPDNLIMRYNLACALCHLDDTEAALEILELWFENATAAELWSAETDPDFKDIHDEPRFQHMAEKARSRLDAAEKKRAIV